jgi:peptide chain release factor subunit 1
MGRFWEEGESLVGRIQTESSKGGFAAWGWRATLAASNAGAVHQMVFEEYEQTRGVRCPACGALGMDEKTCPACGAETLPEEDLMEALLQRTIRQDGDVVILGRPSLLREKAGVGAILRFPL